MKEWKREARLGRGEVSMGKMGCLGANSRGSGRRSGQEEEEESEGGLEGGLEIGRRRASMKLGVTMNAQSVRAWSSLPVTRV